MSSTVNSLSRCWEGVLEPPGPASGLTGLVAAHPVNVGCPGYWQNMPASALGQVPSRPWTTGARYATSWPRAGRGWREGELGAFRVHDPQLAASRRMSVFAGLNRTYVINQVWPIAPAHCVRRPNATPESSTLGLSPVQLEAMLAAAGDSSNCNDFA